MDDNTLITFFGFFIIILIAYLILKNSKNAKKEVDLQELYSKSKFKKTNVKKFFEKEKKDKEKIIEYETGKKIEAEYAREEIIKENTAITELKTNIVKLDAENNKMHEFYNRKINEINGIGPSYMNKLNNLGIVRISDLLFASTTHDGLKKIEADTGIYLKLLEKWSMKADFLRIYGMRNEHIDKLSEIGINSTQQLALSKPEIIRESLLKRNPYTEVPSIGIIKRWVRIAIELQK